MSFYSFLFSNYEILDEKIAQFVIFVDEMVDFPPFGAIEFFLSFPPFKSNDPSLLELILFFLIIDCILMNIISNLSSVLDSVWFISFSTAARLSLMESRVS